MSRTLDEMALIAGCYDLDAELRYIADSPAPEHGGFHPRVVAAAQGAVNVIAEARAALEVETQRRCELGAAYHEEARRHADTESELVPGHVHLALPCIRLGFVLLPQRRHLGPRLLYRQPQRPGAAGAISVQTRAGQRPGGGQAAVAAAVKATTAQRWRCEGCGWVGGDAWDHQGAMVHGYGGEDICGPCRSVVPVGEVGS